MERKECWKGRNNNSIIVEVATLRTVIYNFLSWALTTSIISNLAISDNNKIEELHN